MAKHSDCWKRLFTGKDFDWSFRMRAGDAQAFFGHSPARERILRHKADRLAHHPQRHLRETEHAAPLVAQLASLARSWNLNGDAPPQSLRSLSLQLEPDLLLLAADSLSLAAACVCMPSSWSLDHAIGKPVHAVHESVPRLNRRIGPQIDRFLRSLPVGKSFCRENWSVTLTDDWDYHPDLNRARPEDSTPPEALHLRLEHQLFTALPGGLLMGIRISTIPFPELRKYPADWENLANTIRSMPDNVAGYKGMLGYRDTLARAMLCEPP